MIKHALFLLVTVLLFFSHTSALEVPSSKVGYAWEKFDPTLVTKFRSIQSLISYADAALGKDKRKTLAYANLLDSLVKERFHHGYSFYSIRENWIASLAGTLIWLDLSAIVIPNDIMKYPMAACSQQAIVLMACFKKASIPYRPVLLQGHYTLEGKIAGNWYYFDPSLEPELTRERTSLKNLILHHGLHKVYENELTDAQIRKFFGHYSYGAYNGNIAMKATWFHRLTWMLSYLFPLGLLVWLCRPVIRLFKKRQKRPRF